LLTLDPENVTEVENPLQTSMGPAGATVTDGVGLIMRLNVLEGPLQPLLNGVTVMMVCIGIPDILTAVNASMLPVPESGSVPIKIFVLVQLKIEPGMVAEVNVT
jgi:hypothetical protein